MDPHTLDTSGTTLVEVMIAVVVLVIGLVGLAQSSVHMVNQVNVSDVRTERVVARQAVIEQLKAMPFDSLVTEGADSASVGGFMVSWSITGVTVNSRLVQVIARGPGIEEGTVPLVTSNAVDTVAVRVVRP